MKKTKIIMFVLILMTLSSLSCDRTTETDSTAPTVSITFPANNAEFEQGSTINITAEASDNNGILEVRFYIDGSIVFIDENEPYQYSWDTGELKDTNHSIYVKAIDTNNNSSISQSISIILTETPNNIPTDYLVYYPLNGNSNDSSANGWNAHSIGGVNYSADRFGNSNSAIDYNGSDAYIETDNKLPINNFPLTVNIWFYANNLNLQRSETFYSSDYNDSYWASYYGFWIRRNADNKIIASFAQTAGAGDDATKKIITNNTIPIMQWTMLTVCFDNPSNIKIYLNGEEKSTYLDGNPSLTFVRFSDEEDRFGTDYRQHSDQSYFYGDMDDIRIYKRTLNQSEIDALYHEGGWK